MFFTIGVRCVCRFDTVFPLVLQDGLDACWAKLVPLPAKTIFADGLERLVDEDAATEATLSQTC